MTTKAKFYCSQVIENEDKTTTANFNAVTSGSEENKQFFKYTPSGHLSLSFINENIKFEQGKEYYLEISPCES